MSYIRWVLEEEGVELGCNTYMLVYWSIVYLLDQVGHRWRQDDDFLSLVCLVWVDGCAYSEGSDSGSSGDHGGYGGWYVCGVGYACATYSSAFDFGVGVGHGSNGNRGVRSSCDAGGATATTLPGDQDAGGAAYWTGVAASTGGECCSVGAFRNSVINQRHGKILKTLVYLFTWFYLDEYRKTIPKTQIRNGTELQN